MFSCGFKGVVLISSLRACEGNRETEEALLAGKIRKLPVSKVANKLSHSTNEITFLACPGT